MNEQPVPDSAPAEGDQLTLRYKDAVERAIPRVPVKNGVVDIDSIWVETSLPQDMLRNILRREDLKLPDNVERINLKSRVQQGERSAKPASKRRRNRKRKVRD